MSKSKNAKSVLDYITPEYILVCSDAIVGQDQSITLVRLIDQIPAFALPIVLNRFTVVAQIVCKEHVDTNTLLKADMTYAFTLISPHDVESPLGDFKLQVAEGMPLPPNFRLILDLAGSMSLIHEGTYRIQFKVKTQNTEFETLMTKSIPVKLLTGWPGLYTVKFWKSDQPNLFGQGWVIISPGGAITGADPEGYEYQGSSTTDGDAIQATLTARKKKSKCDIHIW